MNRREVLSRAAAAATLAALLPRSAPSQTSSAANVPVRLGIASYTFRKFDSAHVIDMMNQLRTPYLNVKDVHLPMTPLADVPARAAQFRTAGLELTAAGTIYFLKDEDEDIRQKFDYCKAAGIRLIIGAPTHATLRRVERFAKLYDMRVAIHNHGPEDKEWPSPLDVLAAVQSLDPRMGCCIDVGHTLRAGTDVVRAIQAAGPRLFDIHMKDLADAQSKESQVAVGDGIMPVPAIFEALIAMRYTGFVDLEYEIHPDDPMPGVAKSLAYMRGVLAGMRPPSSGKL